jgi:hypothetical protein
MFTEWLMEHRLSRNLGQDSDSSVMLKVLHLRTKLTESFEGEDSGLHVGVLSRLK